MNDRELWTKTLKTVGAMVGATVVFLGSISLVLLFVGTSPAAVSDAHAGGAAVPATTSDVHPGEATPPRAARRGGRGDARPTEHAAEPRSGESI